MQVQRRHRRTPYTGDRPTVGTDGSIWHDDTHPSALADHVNAPTLAQTNDVAAPSRAEPPRQRQARTRPEFRPRSSASLRRSPVLWGIFGFALGVVFWHAIGFWSFVASVVLPQHGDRDPAVTAPRLADPRDAAQPTARTVSHARPTRTQQQQQQLVTGGGAAMTAPPRIAEPQREMPLPGWGTTIVTSDRDGTTPQ